MPEMTKTAEASTLIAYETVFGTGYVIEPASPRRDWMDKTEVQVYRCLPLVMANQHGWVVRLPSNLTAVWNGKPHPDGLKVTIDDEELAARGIAESHFGLGIITFKLPWLFRTPPGVSLWVHGPANEPKDNVVPLEGVVETDWLRYAFTMNWQVMRRNTPVYFKKGEPICMLTPVRFDLIEGMEPEIKPLMANEELAGGYFKASSSRDKLIAKQLQEARTDSTFGKTYVTGVNADGTTAEEHRTKLRIAPFKRTEL